MQKYTYSLESYNFIKIVEDLFDCQDLHYIHDKLPSHIRYDELHKLGEDNKTWFHQVFYKPINEGNSHFQTLYEKFIYEVVPKHIDGDKFLYQKSPTFRVHTPNNIAVGGWHKDIDYNHPEGEMNFVVCLTEANETSSIWAESSPGKEDYRPLNMKPGEMIQFDGNRCTHGNKVNETGKSRVSFDFRILPYDKYKPDTSKKSVAIGRSFTLGDYYKLYEKNEN